MAVEGFFQEVGEGLIRVGAAIAKNKSIARLLKYSNDDPLNPDLPDVDGFSLLNTNILFVPQFDDREEVTESTILILADRFDSNRANRNFKLMRLRIVILCPISTWLVKDKAPRPLLLATEIDKILNGARMSGIGKFSFDSGDRLVISNYLSGYTLDYVCDSFNQG